VAHPVFLCYNGLVLLSLANDSPGDLAESFFQTFATERVLARLRAAGGAELDGSGAFGAALQAEKHPEWAAQVTAEAAELRAAVKSAHETPLRFVLWAGVGATAADAWMYQAAGLMKRGPRCYVLDSADPGKLKAVLDDIERRSSLSISSVLRSALVVGTSAAMNSFEAVLCLEKLANLFERHRIDARAHFLSMASEGSLLDRLARERGYRRASLQLDGAVPECYGGPLARGSLYPLALARADLAPWIRNACLGENDILTSWRLASFLHAQGGAGRDKVTLLMPKGWAAAATWTKHSFEEALGQSEELGLKIVPCAKPRLANYRPPKDPQQDRVFLAVRVGGMPGPDTAKIGLLRRSGYPLALLTLPRASLLSRYMQVVRCSVFGLAWLRGMSFAARPGADLRESIAQRIFAEAQEAGGAAHTECWKLMTSSKRQVAFRGDLVLHYDRIDLNFDTGGMDAPQLYAAILRGLLADRRIDYAGLTFFGDTRYAPAGIAVRRVLDRAADTLFERRLNIPADVDEGPANNHSCQEMVQGHGRCLSTVLLSEAQEPLAAARYAPDYHVAQFLAAQVALAERGRPVVAITLRNLGETSLRTLEEFFHRAASCLKPGRF